MKTVAEALMAVLSSFFYHGEMTVRDYYILDEVYFFYEAK